MNNTIVEIPINKEKSLQIANEIARLLKPKQCFENTFHTISYLRNPQYKVALGYMMIKDNIGVRHAFLLDETNNEVIDTTYLFTKDSQFTQEPRYILYKLFDMNSYFDAIENSNKDGSGYRADFPNLYVDWNKHSREMLKLGYACIG